MADRGLEIGACRPRSGRETHFSRSRIDFKDATGIIGQTVGDTVRGRVCVAGQRGNAHRRTRRRIFGHFVVTGIGIDRNGYVDLVHIVDRDGEGRGGARRAVCRRCLHLDGQCLVFFTVDRGPRGDRHDACVGVDFEGALARATDDRVGDRTRGDIRIGRTGGDAHGARCGIFIHIAAYVTVHIHRRGRQVVIHIRDVDGDLLRIGAAIAIVRRHGEGMGQRRLGIERLARHERDLSCGGVDLEQSRFVTAGDAVGQNIAQVRIRGRGRRDDGHVVEVFGDRRRCRRRGHRAVIGAGDRDGDGLRVSRVGLARLIIGGQRVCDLQRLAHREEVEGRIARRTRGEDPAEIAAHAIRAERNAGRAPRGDPGPCGQRHHGLQIDGFGHRHAGAAPGDHCRGDRDGHVIAGIHIRNRQRARGRDRGVNGPVGRFGYRAAVGQTAAKRPGNHWRIIGAKDRDRDLLRHRSAIAIADRDVVELRAGRERLALSEGLEFRIGDDEAPGKGARVHRLARG